MSERIYHSIEFGVLGRLIDAVIAVGYAIGFVVMGLLFLAWPLGIFFLGLYLL